MKSKDTLSWDEQWRSVKLKTFTKFLGPYYTSPKVLNWVIFQTGIGLPCTIRRWGEFPILKYSLVLFL